MSLINNKAIMGSLIVEDKNMTYKMHEKVEGKGYFVGYKCKNCGRLESSHKENGKNCVNDARKTITDYSSNVYEANEKKPEFVKFVI